MHNHTNIYIPCPCIPYLSLMVDGFRLMCIWKAKVCRVGYCFLLPDLGRRQKGFGAIDGLWRDLD